MTTTDKFKILTKFVKDDRNNYPGIIIIVGNISKEEMVENLILSVANLIKVVTSIVYSTRIKTGAGSLKLSAVIVFAIC